MKLLKYSIYTLLLLLPVLTSCVPQMRYVEVERRSVNDFVLPLDGKTVSVFPIVQGRADSIALSAAGIGLAEKIEEDRSMERGAVGVYSIPHSEFSGFRGKEEGIHSADSSYITKLMLNTGADFLIFLSDIAIGNIDVVTNLDFTTLILPYSVTMSVCNPLDYSLFYNKTVVDSLYLQGSGIIAENEVAEVLRENSLNVAKNIGVKLGTKLSVQWVACERILATFNDEKWNKAFNYANMFKWREAIEIWMELANDQNPRKAACAAYNVAVGCEILEEFRLSGEWVDAAITKYPLREAIELRDYLKSSHSIKY